MQLDRENNHKRQVNDSDKSDTAKRPTGQKTGSTTGEPVKSTTSTATVASAKKQAEDSVFRTRGDSDDREFSAFVSAPTHLPSHPACARRTYHSRSDVARLQPPPADALILMSTPAGNDNLFNASIVFPVG
jgi:hypothetical protein